MKTIRVARFVAFAFIQLVALVTLTVIAIGPPIVIYETFPILFGFVRSLTIDAGVIYETIIGDAGFVALVGALGIAPYLFSRSADLVPKALRAVGFEYLSIIRDDWLRSKSSSPSSPSVSELFARRLRGITKTTKASLSLVVSFAVLSVALSWASLIVSPSSIDATIRINGDVMLESVIEGAEIDINSPDGSATDLQFSVISPPQRPTTE